MGIEKEFFPVLSAVANPKYTGDDDSDEEPFISVSYLDGSYQNYFNGLEWEDSRLIPEINGSYRTYPITLNDNRGNRIPFKVTEAISEQVDKYINYKTDPATGLSIIDTVDDIRLQKTL